LFLFLFGSWFFILSLCYIKRVTVAGGGLRAWVVFGFMLRGDAFYTF
jgi:hypothetical protein